LVGARFHYIKEKDILLKIKPPLYLKMGLWNSIKKTAKRGIGVGNSIKKAVGRGVSGARSVAKNVSAVNDKISSAVGVNVGKAMYEGMDNAFGGGMVSKVTNAYQGSRDMYRNVQGGDYAGALEKVRGTAQHMGGRTMKNYKRGKRAYDQGRKVYKTGRKAYRQLR
jgi:hypothetical protein